MNGAWGILGGFGQTWPADMFKLHHRQDLGKNRYVIIFSLKKGRIQFETEQKGEEVNDLQDVSSSAALLPLGFFFFLVPRQQCVTLSGIVPCHILTPRKNPAIMVTGKSQISKKKKRNMLIYSPTEAPFCFRD